MSNNNNINEAAIPIVINPISDLIIQKNSSEDSIDISNSFDDPSTTGKVARFELYNTSLAGGIINVLLFDQSQTGAPLTVTNFLNYVKDGDYNNSIIHRSVSNFIVQGGGFTVNNLAVGRVPADPPVKNEFSIDRSNLRGTIAMAKIGGDPNSATNQWFFNLNNNAANLDGQNGGFTVFGQVLSQTDLNVIDAIAKVPVFNATSLNPAFSDLPLSIDPQNPQITSDSDYVRFKSISISELDELSFSVVSNSNPNLVDVSVNSDRLVAKYLGNKTGSAEIRIRATNLLGYTAEDTFIVNGFEPQAISDFQNSASGFNVTFDRNLDIDLINLYDGADDSEDTEDLQILDSKGQKISGSLLFDPNTQTLTFVKTGTGLSSGNYTVNLFSRDDSLIGEDGGVIDGNDDGVAGDDYINNLTIDDSNLRILNLPDFSRAPQESINIGNDPNSGIPISLSDGSGVTQIDFVLAYDANLLTVSSVNLAANLPSSWQIVERDLSTAGIAKVSVKGDISLDAGERNILSIVASVPENASYGATAILRLQDVKINSSDDGVIGDEAVQQVAVLGDISGDGSISSLDASLASRIALGLDSGSDSFAKIDPLIFGDRNSDGDLTDFDALAIAKNAVGLS